MINKCPHCEGNLNKTKYPIKKQEEKTLIDNYKEGTIIWKNLFVMDWKLIAIFIVVMMLAYGYTTDIKKCEEVINNPYTFCDKHCEYRLNNPQQNLDNPIGLESNVIEYDGFK